MKIFVTGGTGFIGKHLSGRLAEAGHEVFILTRSAAKKAKDSILPATLIEGDPRNPGEWQRRAAECDAAINLAGASIFTIWTDAARKNILDSRVLTTRNLVDGLCGSGKSKILLNASAVGYYGSRMDDEILSEDSPPGAEFMSEVCVKWEDEAAKAAGSGARVAFLRFGIVLGRGGGALSMMLPAFRYLLGSSMGSGRQWMPWVHQEDLANIFLFLLNNNEISSAVNCVAPNPVRNSGFAKILAGTLGRPLFLPAAPAFVLRTLLGEMANLVLKGQRVIPKRLMEAGFSFRFPTLQQALENLLEVDSLDT
jgi:hypothetical protein